jgi:hypothetical protein
MTSLTTKGSKSLEIRVSCKIFKQFLLEGIEIEKERKRKDKAIHIISYWIIQLN